MSDFNLDKDKVTASLLYVCEKLGGTLDMYSLLKILYFAECKHLLNYGRPITGDAIIAMQYGPVPSHSYDLVKHSKVNPELFTISENIVETVKKPNLSVFSESDIECLDQSISENSKLSFRELRDKSHDASYEWAIKTKGNNSNIPYLEIAIRAGANEEMIKYIQLNSENQNLALNGCV